MRRFRNLVLGTTFASAAILAASPAAAADYLFDEVDDNYTLSFDGFVGDPSNVIPGLTSSLLLKLTGGVGTNTLTFSYTLTNTSTTGGAGSRVSGFAFDSDPNATGTGATTGDFSNILLTGIYPNNVGSVEVCLTGSASCAGGGGGGAFLNDPASGTFSLVFGSSLSSVTLSDFYVRYQSLTGLGDIGSASGKESVGINLTSGGVPEPATWAMLLVGFGAIGATLRTKKASNSGLRLRVA
jgi:hypothetical protein